MALDQVGQLHGTPAIYRSKAAISATPCAQPKQKERIACIQLFVFNQSRRNAILHFMVRKSTGWQLHTHEFVWSKHFVIAISTMPSSTFSSIWSRRSLRHAV
jgi:hypothetical protein